MLKSVQIKIVIIFMVIGILMIGVQGVLFSVELNKVQDAVNSSGNIVQVIEEISIQSKIFSWILLGIYTLISILVGIFVAKMIINPIARLTESAEMVAKGGKFQARPIEDKKGKTEVDDLTNAFNMMHSELNENLKEVSRQKKQIETILLHMNDGILAFNIEGNIIHKNNAANKLLELTGKEKTFSEIFDKIDSKINLEKIIYLEDWTSTEEKLIFCSIQRWGR